MKITAKSDYRGSDPATGEEFFLAEGDTREVSVEKADQLKRDFPDGFTFVKSTGRKPSKNRPGE